MEKIMKTGKVSDSILKRSVLKKCAFRHPDVVQGAGVGTDSALINVKEKETFSASVHTAVLHSLSDISYEMEHAINNLACSGCLTEAVLLSILLPSSCEETELKQIMDKAAEVCGSQRIQIAGGHTEVSSVVSYPVLTVTALGAADQEPIRISGAGPGMDLLLSGPVGLEGTALLAKAYENELLEKFPLDLVEQAKQIAPSVCIVKEAFAAKQAKAAAFHDLSQGGVFGALWEFCEGASVGMEVDLRKIPIRQETVEICEYFGINPYGMRSGGSLLIAAPDGAALKAALLKAQIPAEIIGRTTDSNDRVFRNGSETRYLDKPAQDELIAFMEKRRQKTM